MLQLVTHVATLFYCVGGCFSVLSHWLREFRQDGVAWAAFKTVSKANSADEDVPVGFGCHDCYEFWVDNFKAETLTFDAHAARYRADKTYKSRVTKASAYKVGGRKDFNEESVVSQALAMLSFFFDHTINNVMLQTR